MNETNTVVVALGTGDEAYRVLAVAIRLTVSVQGRLHVVHVLPEEVLASSKDPERLTHELLRDLGQMRTTHACDVAGRAVQSEVVGHMRYGGIASNVVEIARVQHAEYLVVGPHLSASRKQARRVDATVQELLEFAPCHVILARVEG